MSARYALFESPTPTKNEKKQSLHARIIPGRTIRIERIAKEISSFSSFSSADIKGLLQAFADQIVSHLEDGDTIELEGLGHFSASLKCPRETVAEKIQTEDIRFKTVKFKCCKSIKKRLQRMTFEKQPKEEQRQIIPDKERKQNILTYLSSHEVLQSSTCIAINGCSRYIALKDLKELANEGMITKLGYRKSVMYKLSRK